MPVLISEDAGPPNLSCALESLSHARQTPRKAVSHSRQAGKLSQLVRYCPGLESENSFPVEHWEPSVLSLCPGQHRLAGTEGLCSKIGCYTTFVSFKTYLFI